MSKILLVSSLFTALLLLLIVFTATPVSSGNSGTVSATVTPKEISVLVSPTNITYGVLEVGQNDISPNPDTAIAVNNNGTVTEKFSIKGGDATMTSGGVTYTWTLSNATTGENQFMHKYALGSTYLPWTPFTTAYYTVFKDSEAVNFGESLKFKISMPTSVTGPGEQYTTSIYILAVEAP